jgi:hypothetical protein
VGDAFETELFDEYRYDAVISTEFLEHVEEDLRIIEKIRPGARVYASVPNFPSAAHVRYFESAQEIYDRYIDYFDYLGVDVFPSNDKGRVFYLIEGVRG